MRKSDWLRIGSDAGWIKDASEKGVEDSSKNVPKETEVNKNIGGKKIKVWTAFYSDHNGYDEVGMTIAHGEKDEIPLVVDSYLSGSPEEEVKVDDVEGAKKELRRVNIDNMHHSRYKKFNGFKFPSMTVPVGGHEDKMFAQWVSGLGSDRMHNWVWIKLEGFNEDEIRQIASGVSEYKMNYRNIEKEKDSQDWKDTDNDMRRPTL